MSDLSHVIADLSQLLPETAALIAHPDSAPGGGSHRKPGSKPPWNNAVATVLFDALETIRRLEQEIRSDLAGRHVPPRPHAVTGETLASISRLAHAIPAELQDDAARQLAHHVTAILQLPAIDREERWRKIAGAPCPYCGLAMLLAAPQSGRVTCLRHGTCFDSNGNHPRGVMTIGQASGQPMIAWADGVIQIPPAQEGLAS